ncbi:hypothetical protein ACMU_00585 [Actibacterium mucosum KCTC 23349]|uniref:Short-chain dehydrogenase n=1 Tax=Actibacterium mucosum KCTC 23349 TaxID=1454373 RepID=A0A037ZKR0_9RHOB|nr:SDR family oxidoreductase [Actibacterium mucosum]KAJ57021.1 hypothetical protein ACMU_00585 [Actibacterium mucosum KCTC 23349]
MPNHTPVPNRFKGKVAIVTGGANGIGLAIVEQLCLEGAQVVFSDLSAEDGEARASALSQAGHDVRFIQGDMGDEAFCAALVDGAVQAYGRVDLLVNNAFAFVAASLEAKTSEWQTSYFVGPVGFARMIQNATPHMAKAGGGAVVNIGSISGHIAQKDRWTYNMSKGAVDQLTKCAALDVAEHGIRVNSISPGWIWSREVLNAANADGGGREKYEPIWGAYHMLRRCGETVEVARATLFLLSDDASFITGTDLPVDGGYLSMGPEGIGQAGLVVGGQ